MINTGWWTLGRGYLRTTIGGDSRRPGYILLQADGSYATYNWVGGNPGSPDLRGTFGTVHAQIGDRDFPLAQGELRLDDLIARADLGADADARYPNACLIINGPKPLAGFSDDNVDLILEQVTTLKWETDHVF